MNDLLRLKELAVNPSNSISSYDSISQLCDHILEFRTALSCTGTPWRKRKHDRILRSQLQEEAASEFPTENGVEFSESCLISYVDPMDDSQNQQNQPVSQNSGNLLTQEDNHIQKPPPFKFLPMDYTKDHDFSSCLPMDSDESENGAADTLNSCTEKLKKSSSTDIEESVLSSASTCLDHRRCRRPTRIIKPAGNGSLPVKVVPIGPRFQAEIPPWRCHDHDICDIRWLGTVVWPAKRPETKTAEKYTGQGMDDSFCCRCSSKGSLKCVRKHTQEEAETLENELGEAFLGWRFPEMGDSVLKCWTPKEEKRFIWFMRTSYGSDERSFWNGVVRAFPTKSKRNILSYYFGVFIPHMNRVAQMSGKNVDSDGDEVDGMGVSAAKCKGQYSKYLMNHHICLPG